MAKPPRPRDPNSLARLIVDLSTGAATDPDPDAGKDPKAIARGRAGGTAGGAARRDALSPRKRSAIAKKAATSRWRVKG